jgi:hypothetical protein
MTVIASRSAADAPTHRHPCRTKTQKKGIPKARGYPSIAALRAAYAVASSQTVRKSAADAADCVADLDVNENPRAKPGTTSPTQPSPLINVRRRKLVSLGRRLTPGGSTALVEGRQPRHQGRRSASTLIPSDILSPVTYVPVVTSIRIIGPSLRRSNQQLCEDSLGSETPSRWSGARYIPVPRAGNGARDSFPTLVRSRCLHPGVATLSPSRWRRRASSFSAMR